MGHEKFKKEGINKKFVKNCKIFINGNKKTKTRFSFKRDIKVRSKKRAFLKAFPYYASRTKKIKKEKLSYLIGVCGTDWPPVGIHGVASFIDVNQMKE